MSRKAHKRSTTHKQKAAQQQTRQQPVQQVDSDDIDFFINTQDDIHDDIELPLVEIDPSSDIIVYPNSVSSGQSNNKLLNKSSNNKTSNIDNEILYLNNDGDVINKHSDEVDEIPSAAELEKDIHTLFKCSISGDAKALRELFRHSRIHPDTQDNTGHTPLLVASRYGQVESMRVLIEEGANPLHYTQNGNSAFMLAAAAGQLTSLRFLFEQVIPALLPSDLQSLLVNRNLDSILMFAVMAGQLSCAQYLIYIAIQAGVLGLENKHYLPKDYLQHVSKQENQKQSKKKKNSHAKSLLATENSFLDDQTLWLHPLSLFYLNSDGLTTLMCACECEKYEIVQLVINALQFVLDGKTIDDIDELFDIKHIFNPEIDSLCLLTSASLNDDACDTSCNNINTPYVTIDDDDKTDNKISNDKKSNEERKGRDHLLCGGDILDEQWLIHHILNIYIDTSIGDDCDSEDVKAKYDTAKLPPPQPVPMSLTKHLVPSIKQKYILKYVNHHDVNGNSALHIACRDIPETRSTPRGVNPAMVNKDIWDNNEKIGLLLLELGANAFSSNHSMETPYDILTKQSVGYSSSYSRNRNNTSTNERKFCHLPKVLAIMEIELNKRQADADHELQELLEVTDATKNKKNKLAKKQGKLIEDKDTVNSQSENKNSTENNISCVEDHTTVESDEKLSSVLVVNDTIEDNALPSKNNDELKIQKSEIAAETSLSPQAAPQLQKAESSEIVSSKINKSSVPEEPSEITSCIAEEVITSSDPDTTTDLPVKITEQPEEEKPIVEKSPKESQIEGQDKDDTVASSQDSGWVTVQSRKKRSELPKKSVKISSKPTSKSSQKASKTQKIHTKKAPTTLPSSTALKEQTQQQNGQLLLVKNFQTPKKGKIPKSPFKKQSSGTSIPPLDNLDLLRALSSTLSQQKPLEIEQNNTQANSQPPPGLSGNHSSPNTLLPNQIQPTHIPSQPLDCLTRTVVASDTHTYEPPEKPQSRSMHLQSRNMSITDYLHDKFPRTEPLALNAGNVLGYKLDSMSLEQLDCIEHILSDLSAQVRSVRQSKLEEETALLANRLASAQITIMCLTERLAQYEPHNTIG